MRLSCKYATTSGFLAKIPNISAKHLYAYSIGELLLQFDCLLVSFLTKDYKNRPVKM